MNDAIRIIGYDRHGRPIAQLAGGDGTAIADPPPASPAPAAPAPATPVTATVTLTTAEQFMAAQKALMDGAEGRSLTDEEVARFEELEKGLQAANKTIELRRLFDAHKQPVIAPPNVIHAVSKKPDEAEAYAFERYLRTGVPNMDLMHDTFAQSEGSNSAGGYLVPTQFSARIAETMKQFGKVEAKATVLTTPDGQQINFPTIDDTAHSGEVTAENTAGSNGVDVTLGGVTLHAYKIISLGASNNPVQVSVELVQDSAFDIQALLARVLGTRIGRKKAALHATGTGSSQPTGLMAAAATPDSKLVTASGVITYADLVTFMYLLDPAYFDAASWVFNMNTAGKIAGLVDDESRPILVMQPGGQTLLGFPVVIDGNFPNAADDTNFAVFGDIQSAFVVRNVGPSQADGIPAISMVADPYSGAGTASVKYTAWARTDSALQAAKARVILAGKDGS